MVLQWAPIRAIQTCKASGDGQWIWTRRKSGKSSSTSWVRSLPLTRAAGVPLVHVKPHGALYNLSARDGATAEAIAGAVAAFDLELILAALLGPGRLRLANRRDYR